MAKSKKPVSKIDPDIKALYLIKQAAELSTDYNMLRVNFNYILHQYGLEVKKII